MSSVVSHPAVPKPVELDPQAKKRLLAGIKAVLARLQQRGAVPAMDYAALLGKPQALHAFVAACRADPAVLADLAVDAAGRPVTDEAAPLVCGLSLAQVRQMLVFTCAKRMFVDDAAAPQPPASTAGLSGLFRRKAPPPPQKSDAERKLADLKPLLAFEWQLPLLKYYYFFLDRRQIAELGRDLLLLRDSEQMERICGFDGAALRQARAIAGAQFPELLVTRPEAIAGLIHATPEDFAFFRRILGDRVWAFYARDRDYIDDATALERALAEAVAPLLPSAAPEALHVLSRLAPDKAAAVVAGFIDTFGADAAHLFGDAGMVRQAIHPFVERFVGVDLPADRLRDLADLKCRALVPAVRPWLEKRRG